MAPRLKGRDPMILLIGGAEQGKLAFAREHFAIAPEDVFVCDGGDIDFSKPCIAHIEAFTRVHPDPIEYFSTHRQEWEHSVLILEDIFCGVVPMGADVRAWRQKTGLLSQYLGREATAVSRIFCGLELRLK